MVMPSSTTTTNSCPPTFTNFTAACLNCRTNTRLGHLMMTTYRVNMANPFLGVHHIRGGSSFPSTEKTNDHNNADALQPAT